MYHVIDIQTKTIVRKFHEGQARLARSTAHRLDTIYGAVRYVVRFIPTEA